jgi:hypothetical protein
MDLELVREMVLDARCKRCLGNGIVGHMGIGYDPCPACRGTGERPGHGHNLIAFLFDLLNDARDRKDREGTCP